MQHKLCKFCGQPFDTNSGTKVFCDRKHFDTCIVCGAIFEVPYRMLSDPTRRKTCSKKCTIELRKSTYKKQTGYEFPAQNPQCQEHRKQTSLERYGVPHPMQFQAIQEKVKRKNRENYGVDWYMSTSEFKQKSVETSRMKYGTDYPTQSSAVQSKILQTNMERYGVPNPMQNAEIRKMCADQLESQTGYRHVWANPEVQNKISKTNMERYGVSRVMCSDYGKSKSSETCLTRYGVTNPMQSPEIQSRARATTLRKYGASNYLASEVGKQHARERILQKYGVSSITKTHEWRKLHMRDPSKIEEFEAFQSNPVSYIDSHYSTQLPTIHDLCTQLGVCDTTVISYIQKFKCQDRIQYVYSYMETEVYDFIKSIDPSIQIMRNTKSVITPYELDLYLPEYQLGIECNPTSTHNSSLSMFGESGKGLNSKYHQVKSDLCEEHQIFLFHIFGYEWTHRRVIIESMIRNLLGKSTTRYYARNLHIRVVPYKTTQMFLNENHRQGSSASSVRLGLYTNEDELVSLMTFGRMRKSMGKASDIGEDCWELVRFCNKLNSNVIGGASKLFKHFIKNYPVKSIRSFSDRAHTKGKLYETLGFYEHHRTDPSYVWVHLASDYAYHRVNAQKQNLKKFLQDDTIDIEHNTETAIMIDHGFVQVFDSGNILWEFVC